MRTRPGARRGGGRDEDKIVVFGIHAVEAALANPNRTTVGLLATENAAQRLAPMIAKRNVTVTPALPRDLDRLLGPDAVHQGVALEVESLPPVALEDVDPERRPARARPGDGPAECRRGLALRRSLRRLGARADRAAQPTALRRAGQGGKRRARHRASSAREEPRAEPCSARRAWRSACRPRRGRRCDARRDSANAAARARARCRGQGLAPTHARALRPALPHLRRRAASQASTSPMPPRSRCIGRA